MADGFRIRRISVEGFKGFTKVQKIDLGNRHMFLIGPNGNGKSSVIEAIRWGLFGSTNRQNDIVQNTGYGGECRVEIDLVRDEKEWQLRRILTPGSGGSHAELFDADSKEHLIRAVLPQMGSLDAGEGAYIIFAPQSAPLRRQPENLKPFQRAIFDHLGLTRARALLDHLENFVKEQEDEEGSLNELVTETRKEVDGRIGDLERQRGRILSSPPWDGDLLPSSTDTESKVREWIRKITASDSGKDFEGFSSEALLDEAENILNNKVGLDRKPLEKSLEYIGNKLTRLEKIHGIQKNIIDKNEELEKANKDLQRILDGVSLEELRKQVENRRRNAETLELRRRLGEAAVELLQRTEDEGLVPCPVCEMDKERDELDRVIQALVHPQGEEDSTGLRAIEDRLSEAQRFGTCIQALKCRIGECESNLEKEIAAEKDDELIDTSVADQIESVKKSKDSIERQLDNFQNWHDGVQVDLKKLREEVRYQNLQRELKEMKAIDADMKRVEGAFGKLVRFGESVRDIRKSVNSTLTEELREKIPDVSENMTNVFKTLTKHSHFDRLIISEEKLPELELRVANSSHLLETFPTGVLNGQAESALELVPYFALSQANKAPTEVYLVLLDDPTRAFDKEHIEVLIEQLAVLGQRVQLVVATQETESFRDLLPKRFGRESYVIVEPKNWSYAEGPDLTIECG